MVTSLTVRILLANWKMLKQQRGVYSNDQNVENTESNRSFTIPSFMSRIMADDDISESINSPNFKQCDVFTAVHNKAKEYAKHNCVSTKPVHIFISESGHTGKSHLLNIIYNILLKSLILNSKAPEQLRVILLKPAVISAVNICGTPFNSALGIKPGMNLSGLSD